MDVTERCRQFRRSNGMHNWVRLAGALLLCLTPVSESTAGEAASSALIDSMWANSSPIAHDRCLYFIVKAWPENVLRGRIAPHDCIVAAIREYRRGDHEHAMGWLQAGLCPNREAQQRLVREAPAVFDYLLRVYGPSVP